jgi:hypothetical protein
MTETASWYALSGLGAFHGLNPAMGWLFAVALGLHRHDRRVVWLSPIAIALGHALSVAVVAVAFVSAGLAVDDRLVRAGAGLILIGWAFYHWANGHRHRVRFGLQVGLAGLAAWSFLMATGHGAGLMLWPALMPLCFSAGSEAALAGPLQTALIGIGLHTVAMLVVTAAVAIAVYEWVGLEILRRGWVNVDLIWTLALVAAGGLLLVGALW